MSMKCAPGRDGIVTSPCVCSRTPFLPCCAPRARQRCHFPMCQREKNRSTPSPGRWTSSNARGGCRSSNGSAECGGSATALLCPPALQARVVSPASGLVLVPACSSGGRSSLSLQAPSRCSSSITTVVLVHFKSLFTSRYQTRGSCLPFFKVCMTA